MFLQILTFAEKKFRNHHSLHIFQKGVTYMGLRVNVNRVGALLEYICSLMPHIHLRKLLKVVYLVDEKSVKLRAIPLTWLDYYAWKKGPVAPLVYDVKNGEFSDYVICTKEADGKWHVSPVKTTRYSIDQDMKVFSEYEMDIINSVVAHCESKSADDLTDETHQDNSLWSKTVALNNINFDKSGRSNYIVNLNDLNDADGKEIYADALDSVIMQAAINSVQNV